MISKLKEAPLALKRGVYSNSLKHIFINLFLFLLRICSPSSGFAQIRIRICQPK